MNKIESQISLTFNIKKISSFVKDKGNETLYSPYMVLECVETGQTIVLQDEHLINYRKYEFKRNQEEIDVFS